jgi:diaminopimelate decarboxylase
MHLNMNRTLRGFDILTLAEQFGLPLHLYDGRLIAGNLHAFQSTFQETGIEGRVCYAVKACGFSEIIKVAAQTGVGADVASEYELASTLEAGIPPNKMVIHGNAKSDIYLERVVALDALIAANHQTELDRIEGEAARQRKQVRTLLRLSGFELGPVTARGIFTAGRWCKFGEPVAEVPSLLTHRKRWPHIDLIGFHVHIGSQISEVEPYRVVFGKLAQLAVVYREIVGRPVQVIDLGGGFPVSYVDRRTWNSLVRAIQKQGETVGLRRSEKSQGVKIPPNPPLLKGRIQSLPRRLPRGTRGKRGNEGDLKIGQAVTWEGMTGGFQPDPATGKMDWKHWSGEKFYTPYPKEKMLASLLQGKVPFRGKEERFEKVLERIGKPRLLVEPGRAIVGDAGVTLARVVDMYPVAGGHPLVTLDLGIVNHGTGLVEPDLYTWTLANDIERKDGRSFKAFVAGRLCFSGDLLSRYLVSFPRRPVRGDIAVIEKTGAYASTFFASRANGFPPPACVLLQSRGRTSCLITPLAA